MNSVLNTFAWKNLWYLMGYGIAFPAIGLISNWSNAKTFLVLLPAAFAGLWVWEGCLYYWRWRRRFRNNSHVPAIWDEREEAVFYKALAWGFGSSWIALILAVGWFIHLYLSTDGDKITLVSLSVVLGLCFSLLVLVFSLSVIVQKRGEPGEYV